MRVTTFAFPVPLYAAATSFPWDVPLWGFVSTLSYVSRSIVSSVDSQASSSVTPVVPAVTSRSPVFSVPFS